MLLVPDAKVRMVKGPYRFQDVELIGSAMTRDHAARHQHVLITAGVQTRDSSFMLSLTRDR